MNIKRIILLLFISVSGLNMASAHINPKQKKGKEKIVTYREDCATSKSQVDQQINNVKARLLSGGDVWWDGSNGKYIVPKVDAGDQEVSSIFAGAVWIGGIDPGGNLKIAAQTYGRSSGSFDFYPGPLDPETGTTTPDVCKNWDNHFKVLGSNISKLLNAYNKADKGGVLPIDLADIPEDVLGWPARGNDHFEAIHGFALPDTEQGLAYFIDIDGDGDYQPERGDYPAIEIRGCDAPQYPDEMIFWIYNDAGGAHNETSTETSIQMEIQVQAFAYQSNDQLNDMTFQRYKLINRAVEDIDSTFFGMWVDADLGCAFDDYAGCDTTLILGPDEKLTPRNLMFLYNEDAVDGEVGCDCSGTNTYCNNVPIVGVDYFRGPLAPSGDSLVEVGMSSFIYYNNGGIGNPPPGTTDPNSGPEYYNYLNGVWRDGTPLTDGGTGYGGITPTKFALPGEPSNGDAWSMCTEGFPFGDRRTVQASGPLQLKPGAVNELIVGMVWVPDIDYPCPDLDELFYADGLAQALFDNCFDVTDGPDAPDVSWVALDEEIVGVLSNEEASNNYGEKYSEPDLQAPSGSMPPDYAFEGYLVYQLANNKVLNYEDLQDPSKAVLIFQTDVKNEVSSIYNWTTSKNPSPEGDPFIFTPSLMIEGNNTGIQNTFSVTRDRFSDDNPKLINHKEYYFQVVAYAHNNYRDFNPSLNIGQKKAYLEGRRNIKVYTVIPRPVVDRTIGSGYGNGALITRLEGTGSGNGFMKLTEETEDKILSEETFEGLIYKQAHGPIGVNVYNPLELQKGTYFLEFEDDADKVTDSTTWVLTKEGDPDFEVHSNGSINYRSEQVIAESGFSISVSNVLEAGDLAETDNGSRGREVEYKDADATQWLAFITDNFQGSSAITNWIATDSGDKFNDLDPQQALSKPAGNPGLVPFMLTENKELPQVGSITPGFLNKLSSPTTNKLSSLNNVDVVFTSDKSKWSRCIVVETSSNVISEQFGEEREHGEKHFDLRGDDSVSKYDDDGDGQADFDGDGTGMGWFPGYAIDVETGKRLNVFFGESSLYRRGGLFDFLWDDGANIAPTGADMMFNPTTNLFLETPETVPPSGLNYAFGYQHYIYVTDQEYDECAYLRKQLNTITNPSLLVQKFAKKIKWTGIIIPNTELLSYKDGLIPSECRVSARVTNPYKEIGELPKFKIEFKEEDGVNKNLSESEIETALDKIGIVPNPYLAYSEYEGANFHNYVKITNLPAKCEVTIFSLDGRFIRKISRNEEQLPTNLDNGGTILNQINPDVLWDMKTSKGIPIASGVYLFHIDAGDLGERVIKWFAVSRKFDPSGL